MSTKIHGMETRASYRRILTGIITKGGGRRQYGALTPHINPEVAQAFISQDLLHSFAIPATLVRNCFHIIIPYTIDGQDIHIKHNMIGSPENEWQDNLPTAKIPFHEEALQFSQERWGKHLLKEDWRTIIRLHLISPQDGRSVAQFYLAVRIYSKLLDFDSDFQPTQDDIVAATSYYSEVLELIAHGQRVVRVYNCAQCFGKLDGHGCPACKGVDFERPGMITSAIPNAKPLLTLIK